MNFFNKQIINTNISYLFDIICQTFPHKTAIKTESDFITYEELNQKANIIAKKIIGENIQPQTPILLLLKQEIKLFASIFGVLKTNNIYVVIDPIFPLERLKQIANNCQAKLILTNFNNLELANQISGDLLKIINLDLIEKEKSDDQLNLKISPQDTATIIYTSGSTGQPKGIFRSHQSILHRIWQDVKEGFNQESDRYLSLYSGNFAASIADIFGSLLNGSTLYSYNPKQTGLDKILNLIIKEKITIIRFPIALFRQFISDLEDNINFKNVNFIFLSGDKLYKKDIENIRKKIGTNCIVKHQYGASETGVVSTFLIDKNTVIRSEVIPSGEIVEGKEVIILDEKLRELGINQIGEIAVKSEYLADGYWRNPQLTAQKYITLPNHGQARICLTGDMGKITEDGLLVHLGRKDFMVKVRGYRVDIPEIEAVLYSLDEIKEVVVVLHTSATQSESLVAYIVPTGEFYPQISYLREQLTGKLPDYMIPSFYIILEELPLTDSGKVNRQALPLPPSTRPNLNSPYIPPRYKIEADIAKIWAEQLGLDNVGVEDNFFELGGNSIQAITIVNQVSDLFEIQLSITTLLKSGTVAQMAENIIAAQMQSRNQRKLDGFIIGEI
jgi:amino acid adenylation domain-containing protein